MRIVSPPEGAGWAGGDEYLQSINEMLKENENQNSFRVCWFRNEPLIPKWARLLASFSKADRILRKIFYSNIGYNIPLPISKFTRKSFFWIPDLQDLELPDFFSQAEIQRRKESRQSAISKKYIIYFSSEHAMNIFSKEQYAPGPFGILRFSTLPEKLIDYFASPLECQDCRNIGYFYLPNQWWRHKNHIKTLKAFKSYRAAGGQLHLVLSGKTEDYRWPQYRDSVEALINIDREHIHNLGYLERKAQLSVLHAATIVIQTSLYEGWSTTIEEGLVSGKILVVSDLPIFREQCRGERNVLFVDSTSIKSIVKGMTEAENFRRYPRNLYWRWNRFANDFQQLINLANNKEI